MSAPGRARARTKTTLDETAGGVLEGVDASLLDIVDHVLNQGIVVTGDLVLGVADVDLVYLRASVVLCAADRVLGPRKGARTRHAAGPPGRSLGLGTKPLAGKLGR
jgi:Gas vesicle protein